MINAQDKPWTTKVEIEFINNLGKGIHSTHKAIMKFPRLKLLNKYMQALQKRFDFGEMDDQVVMQHLHEQILEEKRLKLENQGLNG